MFLQILLETLLDNHILRNLWLKGYNYINLVDFEVDDLTIITDIIIII